ncbi:MAG: hypothetical protein JSV49_03805 [Thermoplasmata archaeon]|nr:MAG: hypothetical protein JSV49_03805 [Thermoplasmata archaeon]
MPLSMHNAFTIAFITGIVPAITLLYYTLKEYEKYINDKFMFFAILTGLFLGTLVSFFHLIMWGTWALNYTIVSFALIIISFAIFEGLVKVVFVQLRRFEAKFDTTYYGATFGIIIGASITMGRTYQFFVEDVNIYQIVSIFLFAIAIIFMNGGTGAWLGYGCHKRDMRWTFITVVLVSLPFNTLLFFWYLFTLAFSASIDHVVLIAMVMMYGIGVYLYAYFSIMPKALPLKYQRERLKDARKAVKKPKKDKS